MPANLAFWAALIFAVHPIQAEAVNYLWARSIVVAAVFTFAAWREWRAVGLFTLALLSKEECAAFPLALLLLGRPNPRARSRKAALASMFFLSVLAGAHVLFALSITPGAPAGAQAGITAWRYFFSEGPVIWRYLRLLVFPFGFTVDPQVPIADAFVGLVAWGALIIAAAVIWRYSRWFALGLVLLVPSSSIFPAEDLTADRRMYLASAAFAVAGVEAFRQMNWLGRLAQRRTTYFGAGVVVFLAVLSTVRTYVWMSDERLWREAVARAPGKIRPKIQLARNVAPEEALQLLGAARHLAPDDPRVATETGKVLLSEGNAAAALSEFGRALALNLRDAPNYNNRGVALMALGQQDASRQDFRRALQLDPDLMAARRNLERLGW